MTADPNRSLGDAVVSFRKDVEEILSLCDDAHIKSWLKGETTPLAHPQMRKMLTEELSRRERGALWTAEEISWEGRRVIEVTETRTNSRVRLAPHFLGDTALKFAVESASRKSVQKIGVVKGATVFQVIDE